MIFIKDLYSEEEKLKLLDNKIKKLDQELSKFKKLNEAIDNGHSSFKVFLFFFIIGINIVCYYITNNIISLVELAKIDIIAVSLLLTSTVISKLDKKNYIDLNNEYQIEMDNLLQEKEELMEKIKLKSLEKEKIEIVNKNTNLIVLKSFRKELEDIKSANEEKSNENKAKTYIKK